MVAVVVGACGEDTHCCELIKKKSQERSEHRWVYVERADSDIEDMSIILPFWMAENEETCLCGREQCLCRQRRTKLLSLKQEPLDRALEGNPQQG